MNSNKTYMTSDGNEIVVAQQLVVPMKDKWYAYTVCNDGEYLYWHPSKESWCSSALVPNKDTKDGQVTQDSSYMETQREVEESLYYANVTYIGINESLSRNKAPWFIFNFAQSYLHSDGVWRPTMYKDSSCHDGYYRTYEEALQCFMRYSVGVMPEEDEEANTQQDHLSLTIESDTYFTAENKNRCKISLEHNDSGWFALSKQAGAEGLDYLYWDAVQGEWSLTAHSNVYATTRHELKIALERSNMVSVVKSGYNGKYYIYIASSKTYLCTNGKWQHVQGGCNLGIFYYPTRNAAEQYLIRTSVIADALCRMTSSINRFKSSMDAMSSAFALALSKMAKYSESIELDEEEEEDDAED